MKITKVNTMVGEFKSPVSQMNEKEHLNKNNGILGYYLRLK